MSLPTIKTAIPKRRYQLGEFVISVLGEIESDDPVQYRWIMAVATDKDPTPGIYITAERAKAGPWQMRLAMREGAQVLGESEAWQELGRFVADALEVVSKFLNLADEIPHRLM